MRLKFRLLALSGIAAFTLQGCVKQTSVEEAAAPVAPLTVAEQGGTGEGPALWKLADEDTTIYLFGTVHMLPENVDWYKGPISTALGGAGEVVTEISTGAMKDPGVQADMAMKAMLPVDQNLQSLLNEQDREAYRAAMTKIDLPPATFDRFEPWFVGMSLAVLPLLKSGWNPESGVENIVDQSARKGAKRTALETVDAQLSMFDNLPQESQIAFMMASVYNTESITSVMDAMVAEWLEGDAEGLAALMNEGLTDPVLAKALLYDRNARWASWLDDRMDQPGQVFVAVGVGHLAGENSVQDYLAERGFTVTRVQ